MVRLRAHLGEFYVYILASESFTLYIGMTNNLERRIWKHKEGHFKGFYRAV